MQEGSLPATTETRSVPGVRCRCRFWAPHSLCSRSCSCGPPLGFVRAGLSSLAVRGNIAVTSPCYLSLSLALRPCPHPPHACVGFQDALRWSRRQQGLRPLAVVPSGLLCFFPSFLPQGFCNLHGPTSRGDLGRPLAWGPACCLSVLSAAQLPSTMKHGPRSPVLGSSSCRPPL